eukprot:6618435-Prymnesium_polylepis.2
MGVEDETGPLCGLTADTILSVRYVKLSVAGSSCWPLSVKPTLTSAYGKSSELTSSTPEA